MQTLAIIYRLAIALWLGGVSIFTFVLTPIIFKSYGRDVAGQIVGVLFPAYFRWGLGCGLAGLVALVLMRGRNFIPALVIIVAMIALTSLGSFYIEPKAAALKKEIPSFETTPKDHPLRRQFARLHGISAVANLMVLGGGVALIILL